MNALQGSMLPSSDRGGMHIKFLMRWLSFMKLKPKQIAECNQQKRSGPSTAGTKVNAAGLQLLEELLLSEG
ncbi:hypothetical protein Tco_1269685 [Tanacetum coccineum]